MRIAAYTRPYRPAIIVAACHVKSYSSSSRLALKASINRGADFAGASAGGDMRRPASDAYRHQRARVAGRKSSKCRYV